MSKDLNFTYLASINDEFESPTLLIFQKLFSVKMNKVLVDLQAANAWEQFEISMQSITSQDHIVVARGELSLAAAYWATQGKCRAILLDPIMDASPWKSTPPIFHVKEAPKDSIEWHSVGWGTKQTHNLEKYFNQVSKLTSAELSGPGDNILRLKYLYDTFIKSHYLKPLIKIDDSISILKDEDWAAMSEAKPERWLEHAEFFTKFGETEYGYKTLSAALYEQQLDIISYISYHKPGVIDQDEFQKLMTIAHKSHSMNSIFHVEPMFIEKCETALKQGVKNV